MRKKEGEVYKLSKELIELVGKDALWDRRTSVSTGEKLKDADLIGCPYRIIISSNSIKRGGIEVKSRTSEEEEYISVEQLIGKYGASRKT